MSKSLLIIILNYMDYELTEHCVNKLRENKILYDILIVDNKSSNNSYGYLKKCFEYDKYINVIQTNKNGGYSYGNNYGFLWAENKGYKFYCVMNPDIEIRDELYFEKLIDVFDKNDNIAVVSGVQVFSNHIFGQYLNYWKLPSKITGIIDHSFINYLKLNNSAPIEVKDNYSYVDVLCGACFVVRSDIISQVGYLDDNVFLYYEENILSKKLSKINLKEALCVDALFFHNHKNNVDADIKKRIKEKRLQLKSRKYFYCSYVTKNLLLHVIYNLFSILDLILSVSIYAIQGVINNVHKIFKNTCR